MLYYRPITDCAELQALFPELPDAPEGELAAYVALQQEKLCGKCLFTVCGTVCRIRTLVCSDALLAEGLVRSALHFAANRNAYCAVCTVSGFDCVLQGMGFQKNENGYTGEIPFLLQGSCGHCGGCNA